MTTPGSSGGAVQGLIRLSDLDGCVSTFEQRYRQQDALLEDSVARGVHDEVDHEVRGSLLVQVTLHLRQAHFPTAQAPRTPQACKMQPREVAEAPITQYEIFFNQQFP